MRNLYFRQGLTPFLLGSDTFSRALLLLAVYSVIFSTSSITFPSYLVTFAPRLVTFAPRLVTFPRTQIEKRVSHIVTPHYTLSFTLSITLSLQLPHHHPVAGLLAFQAKQYANFLHISDVTVHRGT